MNHTGAIISVCRYPQEWFQPDSESPTETLAHTAQIGNNLLLLASLNGNLSDLLINLSLEIGIGAPGSKPLGQLIEICAQTLKHAVSSQELKNLHEDAGADGVGGVEQVKDSGQGVE